MARWVVSWSIDVEDAATPEAAALAALAIQRDPESTATIFDVQKVRPVFGCKHTVPFGTVETVYL